MKFTLDQSQQQWIDNTFENLNLKQKIGQLVCERDRTLLRQEDLAGFLEEYPVGSVFAGAEIIDVNADHTENVRKNIASIREKVETPVLFTGDFEHGVGSEVSGLTHLPDLMGLGATASPELAYEYGRIIAGEARSLDVRWTFSPVADLNTNPGNPVTNVRALTDDPDLALELIIPLIKGMQDHGLAAAAKHFPGDGTDTRNQHYVTSVNRLSMEDWRKLHGRVFQEVINSGVYSIMNGHIAFPAYEGPDTVTGNYNPATVSRKLLTELLREKMGFEGVIVTDALSMAGYCSWDGYDRRILATLNSGADIFLWPGTASFFKLVYRALEEGTAEIEQIDRMVKRILTLKALVGLHEPGSELIPFPEKQLEQNYRAALDIAENGVTLLRNRKNVLPLKLEKDANVLVLTMPEHDKIPEILSVFKNNFEKRGYRVTYGCFTKFRSNYLKEINKFAAVILLNNAKPLYGNFPSVPNAIWPFMADHEAKNKIIVSFATPYFLYDTASADTCINAYSDCKATQETVVKLIFGEIPFKGHSPVSCPYTFNLGDGITAS